MSLLIFTLELYPVKFIYLFIFVLIILQAITNPSFHFNHATLNVSALMIGHIIHSFHTFEMTHTYNS